MCRMKLLSFRPEECAAYTNLLELLFERRDQRKSQE